MKKILFFILLVALGAGIGLVHSCRKDDSGLNGRNKTGDDLIPKTDAEIEQKIKVFQQQCEFLKRNPQLKNSSLLLFTDAIWLMEASMNYSYGFPRESSQISRVDSCFVKMPRIGADSVVFQNVAGCYGKIVDSLSQMYTATLWPDKNILLTDLSLYDMTDPNQYTLKMSVVIGKVTDDLVPFGNPYTNTDYWFYGGGQGQCGPYFPNGFGSDAAMQIAQYQQWFLPNFPVPAGYHVYYTDLEEIYVNGNVYLNSTDVNPGDNMLDYLLFYCKPSLPNYHDCLDPSEMWFYLQGLFKVVSDEDKARSLTTPPLKDFISLSLTSDQDPDMTIMHKARIKYGIRHVSNDPMLPTVIAQD